jgi:hypothetical protein
MPDNILTRCSFLGRRVEQQPDSEGDISMGMTDVEKRALKGGASFMETLAASITDASRVSG